MRRFECLWWVFSLCFVWCSFEGAFFTKKHSCAQIFLRAFLLLRDVLFYFPKRTTNPTHELTKKKSNEANVKVRKRNGFKSKIHLNTFLPRPSFTRLQPMAIAHISYRYIHWETARKAIKRIAKNRNKNRFPNWVYTPRFTRAQWSWVLCRWNINAKRKNVLLLFIFLFFIFFLCSQLWQ